MEIGSEAFDKVLSGHFEIAVIGREIVGEVDEVLVVVIFLVDEVGVLNNSQKRKSGVVDI